MVAAHDDPTVSIDAFAETARQFTEFAATLDETERLEAGAAVGQHAIRALTGRPYLTAVGWLAPQRRP